MGLGLLVVLAGIVSAPRPADAETKPDVVTLGNGLTVVLRKVKEANGVSLATMFRVGRDHDPEGRRGMSEMMLRLYATSVAGDAPEKDPQDLQEASVTTGPKYLVRVGRDYMIYVTRCLAKDAPDAVLEMTARMTDLRPSETLVERVRDDLMKQQLGTYARAPRPAAEMAARLALRPEPRDNRPLGWADDVRRISYEEIRDRISRLLRAKNAVVAITGDIDPMALKFQIKKVCLDIPAGEAAPAPAPEPTAVPVGFPGPPTVEVHVKGMTRSTAQPGKQAVVALKALGKTDADGVAPVLVLAARLLDRFETAGGPEAISIVYEPLADPMTVLVRRGLASGDVAAAIRDLRARISDAALEPVGAKDLLSVRARFNLHLGQPLVVGSRAFDLLGAAYADVRRFSLGWSGEAYVLAAGKVTTTALGDTVRDATYRSAVAILDE